MVKKRAKKTTKRKNPAKKKPQEAPKLKWVDKLDFVPVHNDASTSPPSIRIVSWNILAQSYLSPRSHRSLPRSYRNIIFSPPTRRALLQRTLENLCQLDVDVLCLQEVDLELDELEACGYDSVLTPTCKDGGATGGRVDACGVFFLAEKWKLCDFELIRLDDLATLGRPSTETESNLQGLSTSFLRRNVAVLCRLEHVESSRKIVVANAHVYWNPEYEYVKLCQVHYVLQRARDFATREEGIVFCGDLNSPPHTFVHEYLTSGVVNAKRVAPWYRHFHAKDEKNDDDSNLESTDSENNNNDNDDIVDKLTELQIAEEEETQIRYILDYTLNRFTRWLRILGIDAALETDEEEIQRTRENNIILFQRCREERRSLITTSSKLLIRKDCPSGTYLVNPKSLADLEAALVHLLLHHGVVLEPRNFLTRCVVCNGNIQDVVENKSRVFRENNAPDLSDELDHVYECDSCGQGYWWCDRPTSSASRVKSQATRLFELCLRGGVPIKGPLHMFDFVNVEKEREKGLEDMELEHLVVTDWLKQEQLSCPIPLESAYALRDEESGAIVGEQLLFTNVTHDFVGALDYVLFDTRHFSPTHRLYVPTSFEELNGRDIRNGHLLPSADWPSDHLAIGVQLELISEDKDKPPPVGVDDTAAPEVNEKDSATASQESSMASTTDEESSTLQIHDESEFPPICAPTMNGQPPPHPPRCTCGCVPKILSLFEMAELRKQARLKDDNNNR